MRYQDYLRHLPPADLGLTEDLAAFQGVSDVLAWMQKTNRTHAAVDIIAQDEFEYDFLIELKPGGDWIAFGIT